MQETRNKIIWTVLLSIFIFHGVLEDIVYPIKYFDEVIALLCFPLACYDYLNNKRRMEERHQRPRKRAWSFGDFSFMWYTGKNFFYISISHGGLSVYRQYWRQNFL